MTVVSRRRVRCGGVALQGAAGGAGERGVLGPGELVEDVRRHDGAEDGLEALVVVMAGNVALSHGVVTSCNHD